MTIPESASRHGEQILNVVNGQLCGLQHSAVVTRSWTRCLRDFRLDPAQQRLPAILTRPEINERLDRMSELIAFAQPQMSMLYQRLADPDLAVVLTDVDGVIVHMLSSVEFSQDVELLGLRTGAVWSEREAGTNGMGTCLIEAEPVAVRQSEHYFAQYTSLTCSAAPIFNEHGVLSAVLDVTSRSPLLQQHSLALLGISCQMIENRMLDERFRHAHQLHFHSRPELVNTLDEGKLALDDNARVLAANRSALLQLGGYALPALLGKPIDELFKTSLADILELCARNGPHPVPVDGAYTAHRFFMLARQPGLGSGGAAPLRTAGVLAPATPRHPATPAPAQVPIPAPATRLAYGDPQMEAQVRLAQRVLTRRIPVFLHGETGSGKEVFANAMHQMSPARERAFVAINCASLPENLIESELFGYRAGAFTGAQREGRRGKILQANGGTLFLDEIGDMPMNLQSRLLRVLEDRQVSPLGSETVIKVDFQLLSASHRNLAELVHSGQFRADLFYRLNGIELRLPPLRERSDKLPLIQHILAEEARPQPPPTLAPEAVQVLLHYPWPGNLRQLRHALRIALALCDGEHIACRHLPADIVQGAQQAGAPHASALAAQPDMQSDEARTLAQFNAIELSERDTLLGLLEQHRWNVSTVARSLSISRNTLYRKLHRLHIRLAQSAQTGQS
ncbi:sigma-54-dependent Fis family transcriptional regulator [Verminephrobacter eiseniae]|uniref:sigma-54-dependent Fis family transcriptional regulator n=1 Tax=Verminephrobacter eiseniae TaxID=364317 RepID=UPI002237288E|nr:sigma-54-dependent Fis family transcriptional regulator [Verminephrobacter eiseniae]MCW5238738.1 sigma-54-dependent Fis family transcriptional regulator [Verminephrobacter eiseniae]